MKSVATLTIELRRMESGTARVDVTSSEIGEYSCVVEQAQLDEVLDEMRAFDRGEELSTEELADTGHLTAALLPRAADEQPVLSKALRACRRQGKSLRLVVKHDHDDPYIDLPWELLCEDEEFISLAEDVRVVRYLWQAKRPRSVAVDGKRVRVLLTDSFREDESSNANVEFDLAQSRLRGQSVEPLRLGSPATISDLEGCFRQREEDKRPVHVWHHACHGTGGVDDHQIDFAGSRESAETIAKIISAQPSLRLVILTICHAGEARGLASRLAGLNCPAVIGFRSAVPETAAQNFSRSFYSRLVNMPIDESMALARRTLAGSVVTGVWAMPVLFVRTPEIDARRLTLMRRTSQK